MASIKTPREVFDLNLIPSEITFQSYNYMLDRIPVARSLFNSFVFAGGVTLITLVVTSMAGYALARLKFWGRDVLFSVVLLTMMIPFQLLMIPLYVIVVKLGWMNSYAGLILPISVNALGIFIFRQFFRTIPQELIDAARIDGASELQILFRVMLPLSRPAMITVAILTFMGPWNDLLWPLLVTPGPGDDAPGPGGHPVRPGGSRGAVGEYYGSEHHSRPSRRPPVSVLPAVFHRKHQQYRDEGMNRRD